MSVPDVTVVIPTRDRSELLVRHALRSALGQEGVAVEVVVVDDGSVDRTAERVAVLGDARVRVVRRERPGGASVARNAGISVARAPWIAFLDDDDLWAPTKLAAQLAAVGGGSWAYCSVLVVDVGLRVIDLLEAPPPDRVRELLRHGSTIVSGPSNVLVARGALDAVGGFDESLVAAEDWDLWLRLARLDLPVALGEPLVASLDHAGRSFFREQRDKRAAIEIVMRRAGSDPRDAQTLDEWFAAELVRGGRWRAAAAAYARTAWRHRSAGNVPPILGALGGERGMRVTAALLQRFGRGSHLGLERSPPATAPAWLAPFAEPTIATRTM